MKFTFEVWDEAVSGGQKVIEDHVFASLTEARDYARKRIKEDVDKGLVYDYTIVNEEEVEYHIYSDGEEPM